jgi:pimeloyl-ACP methyl ester carboxylesterase
MCLVFVQSDDVLLNVVEWGSPELAAFVGHGGWVDSWELWQEPFQLMQSRWRCVCYDHRGSGATWATSRQISPRAHARLVTLPRTGHVPTLTRPATVVRAIDEWWDALAAR